NQYSSRDSHCDLPDAVALIVAMMLLVPVIQEACSGADNSPDAGSLPSTSQRANTSAASGANADAFRGFHVPLMFHVSIRGPLVICRHRLHRRKQQADR